MDGAVGVDGGVAGSSGGGVGGGEAEAIRHSLTVSDMRLLSVYYARATHGGSDRGDAAVDGVETTATSVQVLPPSLAAGFRATVARALEECGYGGAVQVITS